MLARFSFIHWVCETRWQFYSTAAHKVAGWPQTASFLIFLCLILAYTNFFQGFINFRKLSPDIGSLFWGLPTPWGCPWPLACCNTSLFLGEFGMEHSKRSQAASQYVQSFGQGTLSAGNCSTVGRSQSNRPINTQQTSFYSKDTVMSAQTSLGYWLQKALIRQSILIKTSLIRVFLWVSKIHQMKHFAASLRPRKGKRLSASGGLRPPDPPPGALPLDPAPRPPL